MDHRHALVAVALWCWAASASAFYTSVTPPAGVSATSAASNAIANAQASSKFTSTVTKIPVAIRVATGAGRIAARAIVGGGVIGVAVAGAAWLAENCFEKQGGQWVRTCFPSDTPVSDGKQYRAYYGNYLTGWYHSKSDAAEAMMQYAPQLSAVAEGQIQACRVNPSDPLRWQCSNQAYGWGAAGGPIESRNADGCPDRWYITPAGCVAQAQPTPVTPQQVEDEMAEKPVPPAVWPELVPTQVPIWLPTLNPDPADPTKPMPWKEPAGNPQPIPNTDPQKYKQPWVTIKPAPTSTDPWRVDVQPESTETNSPNPVGPDGIAGPQTNNEQKKPEDKEPDLCEKHPDILACQKLNPGSLEPMPVPNENKPLAINADSGWGPSTAGCPAPRNAQLSFGALQFSYDPLCQFAQGIRPVVIALAWCLAAFAFLGMGRKGD